jgi:PAS domain S-box-containing protein
VDSANSHRRILLVEDNRADARLMQLYLAEAAGGAFELEHVETLEACLKRIGDGGIHLVLLDMSLPDSQGMETFARTHGVAPDLPIIVLSGRDDESLAIQTVHEGAQDYLVKGQVDSRLLVRAIRYAIERKHFEEALAHERDLFHALLQNLPDRIYFKDRESRFIRISKAVCQQFKINHPREAIQRTDFDFFLPEHAQAAFDDERRIMETGQAMFDKVEKETLPDGTITWALSSKLPLRDRQGNIIGNFGISRDITALKMMEDSLKTERNLLRSLIDNLPDYIYVKDCEGRYLLDNISHRRFLGLSSEQEVLHKTVADFFPPEIASKFARDETLIIESGHPLLNREELVVNRAGARYWHATTRVPLRNEEGNIIGLVGISRDITERKEAEQQLQEAHDELARHKDALEQTLAELQQSHEELKAAQALLIEAEKMQSVGRLAAGVAHEVKNPLSILRMGLDYLRQNVKTNDPDFATILGDMSTALERADHIIGGLLDFSVPSSLNLQLEDLNSILEQTLAMVKPALTPFHRIVRDYTQGLPSVRVDRKKIIQVFVNLLTNALHAMPNGGTLALRTHTRRVQTGEFSRDEGLRMLSNFRAGETIVVGEVLDSGTGIAQEKLDQVYDAFFTTKPAGQGTGLGLTVTKKIVELHNGVIDIRNRPEGGVMATVIFRA